MFYKLDVTWSRSRFVNFKQLIKGPPVCQTYVELANTKTYWWSFADSKPIMEGWTLGIWLSCVESLNLSPTFVQYSSGGDIHRRWLRGWLSVITFLLDPVSSGVCTPQLSSTTYGQGCASRLPKGRPILRSSLGTVSKVSKISDTKSFRVYVKRGLGSKWHVRVEIVMEFLSLTFEKWRKFPARTVLM